MKVGAVFASESLLPREGEKVSTQSTDEGAGLRVERGVDIAPQSA